MRTFKQFLVALLVSLSLVSNAAAIPTDFQDWTQVTALIPLEESKKYEFYFEAQSRVGDDWQRMERLLIRPALWYNFSKNLSFAVGYAWTPTFIDFQYHHYYRDENRVWEQVLYKHDLFGLQWQHRVREEQRFIEHANGTSNRIRYLLRGSYGFDDAKSYGLTGYNEIFVTFNTVSGGPQSGFDRDRIFFGPYIVSGKGRYEFGYLGEYAKHFGNGERYINALLVSANYAF